MEGWHHRLNTTIGTANPNVYVFVAELKYDYAFSMTTMKQLEQNISKPPRKTIYL